uniref:Natural resistance-associated macrophage protein n=1 Tax=Bicosoecida sp. CB-2014 TaxID=1486930 RepID=A0A7S1C5G1_9STRA
MATDTAESLLDHDHEGEVHIPSDSDDDADTGVVSSGLPQGRKHRLVSVGSLGSGDGTHRSWFHRFCLGMRKFWAYTGPGWLMSIAYLDPGNLTSDLQSGVVSGYSLGWVLFWSTVFGLILQVMAARLGVVTGKGLSVVCRENYNKAPRIALWLCIELAVLCADVQEVVGSSIALKLLFGMPLWAGVLLTGLDTFFILAIEKCGVRKLEFVFAILIVLLAACFFIVFGMGGPDWASICEGIGLPDIPLGTVEQAVGTLGAVVMPHNIFLHSSLVLSRNVDRTSKRKTDEAIFYFTLEAAISLFVSFLINMAIVAVFAQQFYPARAVCPPGEQCTSQIGLSTAGSALSDALGSTGAQTIWALGVLAAGQASTLTGTYAGQFIMTGFLNLTNFPAWQRAAITRSIALVPAVIVAVASKGFFDELNELLNVVQSIILPFALLPLLKATNSKRIMGPYHNHGCWKIAGWALSVTVIVTNFYLVALTLAGSIDTWWEWTILVVVGMVYAAWCFFLFKTTLVPQQQKQDATALLRAHEDGTPLAWWEEKGWRSESGGTEAEMRGVSAEGPGINGHV